MRSVVVFPAPFGPSSPKTSPGRASKETPSTARTSPGRPSRKTFVRPSTMTMAPLDGGGPSAPR